MAQVSYEDVMSSIERRNKNKNYAVKWFSLKDGESSIVRIMHKGINDLDFVDVHEIKINDKPTKVACLRKVGKDVDYLDGTDKCPYCSQGIPILRKMYIHLIEYTQDNMGNMVLTPKVWEKNAYESSIKEITGLIRDYGDLTNSIFKITREGEKQSTRYHINYMPPAKYPEDVYKKDESLFDGVTAITSVVRNYDYNKSQELIANGFKMEYKNSEKTETIQNIPQNKTQETVVESGVVIKNDNMQDTIVQIQPDDGKLPWDDDESDYPF